MLEVPPRNSVMEYILNYVVILSFGILLVKTTPLLSKTRLDYDRNFKFGMQVQTRM